MHYKNLEYILKKGKLTSQSHPDADPDYLGIGDESLKECRREREIQIPPGGTFSDYVAFYFGPRSPMLFNIKNGFMGVRGISQVHIIYLVSSIALAKKSGSKFIFTDGHGNHRFSQIYNDYNDLDKVDWDYVNSEVWFDDPINAPDRKRKKQAEFLYYNEIGLDSIIEIGVLKEDAKNGVEKIVKDCDIDIPVVIKREWYY